MNNPVCLSQNKPVREGSSSKSGRLEQRGARPLVISPVSGRAVCLDPQPLAQYTASLPAWLPDWLRLTPLLLTLSPPLSCSLTPSLLLSTLESENAQIGKVFLRPAPGQLEDSTERTFPSTTSLSLPESTWMNFLFFWWRQKNKR